MMNFMIITLLKGLLYVLEQLGMKKVRKTTSIFLTLKNQIRGRVVSGKYSPVMKH